jgi:hypothetical protein
MAAGAELRPPPPAGSVASGGPNAEGQAVRTLLIVTAAVEAATGLALLVSPSLPVSLLLGAPLDAPVGQVIARVAGAALLSLGVACWLARSEPWGIGARGLIGAMLLYNVAVGALLAHAAVGVGLVGLGLWPAVLVHVALAIWCVAGLRRSGSASADGGGREA